MQVGGARCRSFAKQAVDEIDDRRIERHVLQVLLVLAARRADRTFRCRAGRNTIEEFFDARHDLAFRRQAQFHRSFAGNLDRRLDRLIGGIGDGDGNALGIGAERQYVMLAHEAGRNPVRQNLHLRPFLFVKHWDTEIPGELADQHLLVEIAEPGNRPHWCPAVFRRGLDEARQLLRRDQAAIRQAIKKFLHVFVRPDELRGFVHRHIGR